MDPIEQATLYIKDRRNLKSAAILSKTPGIRQVDEDELIGWAFDYEGDFHLEDNTSHVTTSHQTGPADSDTEPHLYFHPLPSGCYALGRLSQFRETEDDSISLFSHCLIVTPRLLRAFHNNILMIYQALIARKHFHFLAPKHLHDVPTLPLTPINMGVRHTPVIRKDLLEAIHDYPGAEVFTNLLSLSVNSVCTVFTWLSPSIPLINGVIQCLPIPLRSELSFATSLHFSALRPLRLIAAHESSRSGRDICRQFAIPFFHIAHFDVNLLRERLLSHQDWATLIYLLLNHGAYDDIARCLTDKLKYCSFETQRGTPDWNLLHQAGKSLLKELHLNGNRMTEGRLPDEILPPVKKQESGLTNDSQLLRGDASHKFFQREDDLQHSSVIKEADLDAISEKLLLLPSAENQQTTGSHRPSQRQLAKRFPLYEREIRRLDSLLARSLFGDTVALDALDETWRDLRNRMTFQEIETIRETYLHLIQSIIVLPRDPEYPKPPRRTIDSLEVMNIFLQD